MTDPAPSPPAGQPPVPNRPMPTLGHGVHWPAIIAEIDRDQQRRLADLRDAVRDTVAEVFEVPREIVEPPPTASSAGKSACSHGTADGTYCWPCAQRDRGKELRAYAAPVEAPPAIELLAMADDLNAHGGLDETFVAGLLQAMVGRSETGGNEKPSDGPPYVHRYLPPGEDEPPSPSYTYTSPSRRARWLRALDRARRWRR